MAKDPNKIQDAMKQTRERLGDAIDAVVSKSDVASRVNDTVTETAVNLKARLADGADTLSRSTDTVRGALPQGAAVRQAIRDPIALAIGVAAVGFVAGLLIPLSDVERVRLEPIGDDLAQRAADARDEIVEQSRQVVAETVSAARVSVQKHGEQLADHLSSDSSQSSSEVSASVAAVEDVQTGGTVKADPAKKSSQSSSSSGSVSASNPDRPRSA